MLQEEIGKIGEYFRSIENYGDALIVKVQFPQKWSVYASDDGRIKPAPSDSEANTFFYYGDSKENVTLEEIFSFISDTIKMNKDVIKKINLLKEKIDSLKELFATTPLEKLENLKFVIEEEKPKEKEKPKRKYTRKKKAETKEEKIDDVSGNTEESMIEISPDAMKKYKMAKSLSKK